jgi:hypothetical protein
MLPYGIFYDCGITQSEGGCDDVVYLTPKLQKNYIKYSAKTQEHKRKKR